MAERSHELKALPFSVLCVEITLDDRTRSAEYLVAMLDG